MFLFIILPYCLYVDCPDNCDVCSSGTLCTSCSSGYENPETGCSLVTVTSSTFPNCEADDGVVCTECAIGFYFDPVLDECACE